MISPRRPRTTTAAHRLFSRLQNLMEGSLFRYARQIDWFHGRGYRQFEAILSRASHRSEYDNITTPGRLFEAWNQAGKPLAICNCAATARWYPGIPAFGNTIGSRRADVWAFGAATHAPIFDRKPSLAPKPVVYLEDD